MLNRSKDTAMSETVIGNEGYSLPQFSSDAFTSFCATSPGEERRRFLESLSRDSPEDAQYFIWLDETGFLESLANFDNSIEAIRNVPSYAGYRLLRTIAEGGSAKVFKASAERTGVTYAIKIPHQNDEESRERLHREFEILASVDSAHIPRPVAHSIAGDEPFLSMQLIDRRGDGSNRLDDILEMEDVPLETKVRWFKELLSAMGELHSHGFVHRDIKLSNLLVGRGNAIYLIDFGIAVADCTLKPRLSKSDSILGTPPYVAPELLDGYEPSFTADIYSAGFLLLELLSEKRAHSSNEKLATLDASLEPFDGIVEKACSKNPAVRYQTSNEFLFAIDSAFDDYKNHEKWNALKRQTTINRFILAGCLIGSFLALVVAGAAYVKQLETIRRETVELTTEQLNAFPEIVSVAEEVKNGLGSLENNSREFDRRLGDLQMQIESEASKLGQLDELLERIEGEVGPDNELLARVREQLADSRRTLALVVQHLHDQEHFYETFGQFGSRFDEVEEENRRLQKEVKALTEWIKAIEPRER